MKKALKIMMVFVLTFVLTGCNSEDDKQVVGVIKLMDHTSLNTIEDSIKTELEKNEIEAIYKNANGDTSTLKTLVEQVLNDGADVIIAITSPVAQAAAPFSNDTPIIFSAVTDPIQAGLVTTYENPDKNITGTSDELALEDIIDLMIETYPNTKEIGFLYNTGEVNSVSSLEKFEKYASTKGLNVVPTGVTNSSEINMVLAGTLDKVDVVFSPNDNTIAQAMSVVGQMCKDAKIPMFTGADSMVQDGGLMTYGINYDLLGQTSAKMAIDVLNGKEIKDIPVKVFKDDLSVYLNETTAKEIGFENIADLKEKYQVITFE